MSQRPVWPIKLMMWLLILFLVLLASACVDVAGPPVGTPTAFVVKLVPMASPTPGSSSPTPLPESTVPPAEPTKSPEVLSPLSGKLVSVDSEPNLRPFALKIDNSPPGRPQSGISQACIVYEYLAEGGVTRLLAIFQNEANETPIGPVRSMRMVDIDLVPQFDAVFGYVGSSQRVARAFSSSSILDMNEFYWSGAYQRVSWRRAPYNVYTSVQRLKDAASAKGWDQPSSLQPYVFSPDPPTDASPATAITIPFHASNVVQYRYDAERGAYLRFADGEPQIDANTGEQIEATNVVVQYVKQWVTDFFEDAGGAPSLQTEVIGDGKAEIFRDGIVIPARWVQKSRTQRTQFLDDTENPVAFKQGNTWIALLEASTEVRKAN